MYALLLINRMEKLQRTNPLVQFYKEYYAMSTERTTYRKGSKRMLLIIGMPYLCHIIAVQSTSSTFRIMTLV